MRLDRVITISVGIVVTVASYYWVEKTLSMHDGTIFYAVFPCWPVS
jgi:hypothetical protein